MGAVSADQSAHAHLGCAIEQALGDEPVCFGDAAQAARDGQHAVVNTLNNLAYASADASLIAEVRDVLACLPYDNSCFFGRDNGAQGELRLGVLFFGARDYVDVVAFIEREAIELLGDAISIMDSLLGFFGRHDVEMGV